MMIGTKCLIIMVSSSILILKPEKVALEGPNGIGTLGNQTAYRAAQTNVQFGLRQYDYNSTNKIIGWED